MFNFSWGVLFVVVNFALFLAAYRLFGRMGLYAWVGAATVIANIQVVKTIEMFGLVMTLGNTAYASIYLSTDLLNEKFGEKAAKKAVWLGFFTLLMTMAIMQMALVFEPFDAGIDAQGAMSTLFGLMPRLAAGSLTAYLISQYLDVKVFSKLRQLYPGRGQLWIRTNGSTLLSQLIDTLVFCSIAFLGVYSFDVWWEIALTTYLIKIVVSIASTPVIYLARSFRLRESE